MKLLIDTDAFCKLGIAGLLQDATELFHATVTECRRLPALPYMLRRGSLRKHYGISNCEGLIRLAEGIPPVGEASTEWLDQLAHIESVDPGEAHLYSFAAEHQLPILSGDKRALRALKDVGGMHEALSGKIATLESIVLELCARLGVDAVRSRLFALSELDQMIRVCFSAGSADPQEGLRSYVVGLATEVQPLLLWPDQRDSLA